MRYFQEDWQGAAQAYVVAAMLGPPASSIGRHMAAVCLRELGLDFLAAFLFKETLEIDPLGISTSPRDIDLPNVEVLSALKEWSRSNIQIGIVTLPRALIMAHVRLANGRFVMVYPVVPSMNEAERDSKYLEACDFGKPLRRFRRHQS